MLKIKDNVDWRVLEEIGFHFDPFSSYWWHECGLEFYVGYEDETLELELAWDEEGFNIDYCIDIIFDLTRAGLIEKVPA